MKLGLGISLIILGMVASVWFSKYTGDKIPYLGLWYAGSISLIGLGLWIIKKDFSKTNKEIIDELEEFKNRLKRNGKKIEVDLNECTIQTHNYIEEREKNTSTDVKTLDALYEPSRNVEHIQVNQAVLIYKKEINGEIKTFYSPVINKDEVTIKFLLDAQKKTIIYYDTDSGDYYFDVE